MDILLWVNVVAQIATAIGVVVAIYTIWSSAKINRIQMNMQVFMAYTTRFEEIMGCFPENAFQARYELDNGLPPESKQLTLAVIRYLNLTSEEYYLWKRKYLDDTVWQIWESEIKRTLRSPLVRREWPKIVHEFVSYPEFVRYVRDAQSDVSSSARGVGNASS